MDAEMLAFFPNGIRALLVDDDSNFLKSSTMMLSKLQYKVATCGSPTSGLKLLSSGRVKDVDVVLVDAHQVSVCSFDLCTTIENDLNIPLIYFMSSAEKPAASSSAQSSSHLARLVQSATFIMKKPFDAGELRGLWRVVAWRRCVLENARRAKECKYLLDNINNMGAECVNYNVARANNGVGRCRNNHGGDDDNINGSARSSETQKQQIMWTPCLKKKFEHALNYIGTGGHPSEILEHMNVKGLRRHHVASYLQNPVGGDISSSSAVPVAIHASEEQQQSSNATAFTGNAAPGLPPWDVMIHQPTEDLSSIVVLQEAMQPEQHLSSGAAATIDQHILFTPFTYQCQFPPGDVKQQQVMVAAATADDATAEMVAELMAASDSVNGLVVPPYDNCELGAVATASNKYNTFSQLEAFLQLDSSVSIDGSTATNGTRTMMNGDEGGSGTKIYDLGTDQEFDFLEEVLRDNIGDHAPE